MYDMARYYIEETGALEAEVLLVLKLYWIIKPMVGIWAFSGTFYLNQSWDFEIVLLNLSVHYYWQIFYYRVAQSATPNASWIT